MTPAYIEHLKQDALLCQLEDTVVLPLRLRSHAEYYCSVQFATGSLTDIFPDLGCIFLINGWS